jgi:DNA-binding NarL/FixJ family response regulator
MPDMSGLFLSTKLLEINPKLNVILLSDHFHDDDLKYIINLIFLKSVYQYTN